MSSHFSLLFFILGICLGEPYDLYKYTELILVNSQEYYDIKFHYPLLDNLNIDFAQDLLKTEVNQLEIYHF